jgi:hypothetical protein
MFISITPDYTAYISDEFNIPDILTLRLSANRQMEVLAVAKSMMPNCQHRLSFPVFPFQQKEYIRFWAGNK